MKRKRSWPVWVLSSAFLLMLLPSLSAVFHPYEGLWMPVRAYSEGQEQEVPFRLFLEIENGKADISTYWICGPRQTSFANGEIEVHGNELILYGRNEVTGQRYPMPNARLQRLTNGRLAFNTELHGKMTTIEFERERTLKVFDLFRDW